MCIEACFLLIFEDSCAFLRIFSDNILGGLDLAAKEALGAIILIVLSCFVVRFYFPDNNS